LVDGSQCFAHAPGREAARAEARQRGGRNKRTTVRLQALLPPRLVSVAGRLETALADVLAGDLDPKQATAAAAVARALVAVFTAGELEQRVRDLEREGTG